MSLCARPTGSRRGQAGRLCRGCSMDSSSSDGVSDVIPIPVKIIIAGGFGVGKTTMVGSVSEIPPLSTEELLTEAGDGVDDLSGVERKTTTTVALDFGRITLSPDTVL